MDATEYKNNVAYEFRKLKALSDRALEVLSDDAFFLIPGESSNSIGIVVKHMAGNMRSRWLNFLTTDGEKPDRNRDAEFVISPSDTRASLMSRWESGWTILLAAINSLQEEDFVKTVQIRGEPHLVLQAINRQLTHYAYHVGQIVFQAKNLSGKDWKSLSVPKGMSEQFRTDPRKYLNEDQD